MRLDRGDGWFEPEASADGFTLVAVTYGRCVYWIGARHEKVILEKGELLLIPAGEPFYGKGVPTTIHEKYVVQFSVPPGSGPPVLPVLGCTRWKKSKAGAFDVFIERLKAVHIEW